MPEFDIEQYREPWETNSHWKLKREFIERYQDDFPEEKLVCLAQAYSNIESIDCRYPESVMTQIYELSKPLHGSKRCKEEEQTVYDNGKELMSKKRKREPEDKHYKQMKFTKFCPAKENVLPAANTLIGDTLISTDASKCFKCKFEAQMLQNASKVADASKCFKSCRCFKSKFEAQMLQNASKVADASKASQQKSSSGPQENNTPNTNLHVLISISKSPNFELLVKIAGKIADYGKSFHLTSIKRAFAKLDVRHLLKFKFSPTKQDDASTTCIVKFYIGGTLISTGRGQSRKEARSEAVINSKDIFANIEDLPKKTLDELKESIKSPDPSLSSEVKLFQEIGSKIKKNPRKSTDEIMKDLKKELLKIILFNVREKPPSALNHRLFSTDLVINGVLIGEGKGITKEKSKHRAMVDAVSNLIEFADSTKKEYTGVELAEDDNTDSTRSSDVQMVSTNQTIVLESSKADDQSSSKRECTGVEVGEDNRDSATSNDIQMASTVQTIVLESPKSDDQSSSKKECTGMELAEDNSDSTTSNDVQIMVLEFSKSDGQCSSKRECTGVEVAEDNSDSATCNDIQMASTVQTIVLESPKSDDQSSSKKQCTGMELAEDNRDSATSNDVQMSSTNQTMVLESFHSGHQGSSKKEYTGVELAASNSIPSLLYKRGPEDNYQTDSNTQNNNPHVIISISKSSNFELLVKIAEKIADSNKAFFENNFLTCLKRAVAELDVKHLVKFKFSTTEKDGARMCAFFIGDTLISTGRGQNKRQARSEAVRYSKDIFANIEDLPNKTLDELKESIKAPDPSLSNEVKLFQKIGSKIKKTREYFKARKIMIELKETVILFNVREDPQSALNHRLFSTDVVINGVLIGEGKGISKRKSEDRAMVDAVNNLIEFADSTNKKEYTGVAKDDNSDSTRSSHVQMVSTDGRMGIDSVEDNIQRSSSWETENLNKRLLKNSKSKQFVVLDSSRFRPSHKVESIVKESAEFCGKDLHCKIEKLSEGELNYRCEIYIDNSLAGTAEGMVMEDVQAQAFSNTLNSLQQNYYTIVVKDEEAYGITVGHTSEPKNSCLEESSIGHKPVDESNIGHKMLKMMGWNGGGVGKNEGIIEPISVGETRFRQGLGFESRIKNKNLGFESRKKNKKNKTKWNHSKIRALLLKYKRSSTIGDLIFPNDLDDGQRYMIHRMSNKLGLKSKSFGEQPNRQLHILSDLTLKKLLTELICAGGSTSQYELVDRSQ